MTGPMIVQILIGEGAPGRRNGMRPGNVAIDQEGDVVCIFGKSFEDEFAAP